MLIDSIDFTNLSSVSLFPHFDFAQRSEHIRRFE